MRKIIVAVLLLHILSSASCNFGLSGSSLSPDIQTCQIAAFPNYSNLQNPTLSQDFTIDLQNRFDRRTQLELIDEPADINIEGEITDYRISSENTTSNDVNSQNKVTISVKVRYDNTLEPEKSFDKVFTDFENYGANDVQPSDDVIEDVLDRIINQIFNAIVADW